MLGLFIRIATLPLPGHEDVLTWKIWSYAASRDVTAMYGVGGVPPTRGVVTWGERGTTVDYPPFFLYEYAVLGRVYGLLFPEYPDSVALLVAVKLPVLLANAGLAWLLYATVRRLSGRDETGRWAALAYWLNPATMFGGEMLGYVDPLLTLPALAGFVLAFLGWACWPGILMGIAIATKPQGVLILPAFALVLWQAHGVRALGKACGACVATLAVIVLPFFLRGALPNMWLAFGSFYGRRNTLSAYAANVGWIINWALRSKMGLPALGFPRAFMQLVPHDLSISRFMELGYPNPRPFATGTVLLVTAWAVWLVRRFRDLSIASALAAFTVHTFFVLGTGVHEHHQLFEVPLLILTAGLRPRFRPILIAVSAIIALNINFYYGISLGMGWAVPRMITGIDLSVLLAFANVGVLFWFAHALRNEIRAESVRNVAPHITFQT